MTPNGEGFRSGGLTGARVLVPRGGAWGERVSREIERRGGRAVVAPLIASAPPRDTAARDRAFATLAAGEYEWLFVTSAAGVEQLVAQGISVPRETRIATVGQGTASALAESGASASFVPAGASSAAAMIAQWSVGRSAAATGRCLVLRSDLAAAVVSDELEAQGYGVDVCIGYRTVGLDLSAATAEALRTGAIDVVLLTSLSVARELRRQVGALDSRTLVASIGPGTTKDAERLGFQVGYTAQTQTVDALLAELDARVPRIDPGSEDPR
ncbi:uroporphyrinogen-III synthase [Microbacterium sp.]|uniref:uroporphyrinogen-III synthase n=1 Tax=Microbacterium sp. TaxID=51671 RepID=UPI0025FBFD4C|nr:uroporphyrinogen-III synthase [Microbacterium sp.]